ncbi:MAG: hypothetical protein CMM00_02020 [Rhodopirellula sp.]|nr:hypothetical protein [Rhodopirellula sp.]
MSAFSRWPLGLYHREMRPDFLFASIFGVTMTECKFATRRKMQFSMRTLLIAATLLGPLLGWYGPTVCSSIRVLLFPKSSKQAIVTVNQIRSKARLQRLINRQATWRTSAGVPESIELGMQVDSWRR